MTSFNKSASLQVASTDYDELKRKILAILKEIAESMQPGDSLRNCQPHYDEHYVPNGIKISGYDGYQIDHCLKLLLKEQYIEGQEIAIGIALNRLTQSGYDLLNTKKFL